MREIGWRTLVGGRAARRHRAHLRHVRCARARLRPRLSATARRAAAQQDGGAAGPAPGRQILPYLPPDMLYAMCRYELTGGPVAVTAAVSGPGWVLSLHTPQGDNFYVLPGQQLRRSEVSFLLVPSGTVDAAQSSSATAAQPIRRCIAQSRGPDRGARPHHRPRLAGRNRGRPAPVELHAGQAVARRGADLTGCHPPVQPELWRIRFSARCAHRPTGDPGSTRLRMVAICVSLARIRHSV